MNASELQAQILKYKARRTKIRISHYSTFLSLALTLSIFAAGFTWSSLISFLIVIPVPLYFCLESLKFIRKSRQFTARFALLESHVNRLSSKFSFRKFLTQPSLAFRLSLLLFFLLCLTTLARTRTRDVTISYQPQAVSRTP